MQQSQQRHRRKSTVRRAPIESGENPCAPLPTYKMPSIVTNTASDQVKRTRRDQARSSEVAQPPSSHRSTVTAEHHTLHHALAPIRTRHATAGQPAHEHWHGVSPSGDTPATQRSALAPPARRQSSTMDSVADDVFWATIDRLGGREPVLARLMASNQPPYPVAAASLLPPMLSMESSKQQEHARGRRSAGTDVPSAHADGMARIPDAGHSSGGEESMDIAEDGAAPAPEYSMMMMAGSGSRHHHHSTSSARGSLGPHDAGVRKRNSIPSNSRDSKRHYVHDATCFNCGSVPSTPQMRRGPCGERTLCNACGSKLLKGTYMPSTAAAYPSLYPINHSQRLIYWPGKQTRAEEMSIHAELVHTVMNLLNKGYRFQYEKQDAANQTLLRLQDFTARNGKPPRHRGAVLDPPPPPPLEQDEGEPGHAEGLAHTQGGGASWLGGAPSVNMQGQPKQTSSPAKVVHLQAWAGAVAPPADDSSIQNLALLSATVAAENLHQQE